VTELTDLGGHSIGGSLDDRKIWGREEGCPGLTLDIAKIEDAVDPLGCPPFPVMNRIVFLWVSIYIFLDFLYPTGYF
jgi:hypothetical protein